MKKTHTLTTLLLISIMAIPMIALAQTSVASINTGLGSFGTIITTLTSRVVSALSTLAATAAMVVFFYGIVQYIWGVREGDESRVQKGNVFLRWGLVALFVMFSVWGIIIYVQNIFGIQNNNRIVIPTIQLQNGGMSATNPFQPADGTVYYTCNGTKYATQAEYLKACPQNSTTGTVGAGSDGCTSVNASCTTSAGQGGHCVQGTASRDYALYCSPDAPAQSQTTSTSCNPGNACTIDGFNGQCGTDGICRAGGTR